MKRKSYKKIILATLISLLLIGSAGAVYATQPYVSEKLILSEETSDVSSSAVSRDGKTVTLNYDVPPMQQGVYVNPLEFNSTIISGENWDKKTKVKGNMLGDSGLSQILAFSTDGKIAAGYSLSGVKFNKSLLKSMLLHKRQESYIQATIWSGDNWGKKTDLGTLSKDDTGISMINTLSADGKVAAGSSQSEKFSKRATIWSGNNWATKTDLGTLRSDNSGISVISSLSADGKIAAGNADSDLKKTVNDYDRSSITSQRAVIWSGDNWGGRIDPGSLRSDNLGKTSISALSDDGKIAAGQSEIEPVITAVYQQAVIWSGENWATKTRLGSLRSDSLGNSKVVALSADGRIAAGYSETDSKTIHAIIWSGENWATKTDLGTFTSDNSGLSMVEALSADGTIAVGFSSTDAKGQRAVLWKIIYPASSESGSNAPNSAHIQPLMQPTQ
ncbi:hypothetical protein [Xylella fastidiosa]|uniref:hypothetical protein n=1 Tax=Xylella fastidiosa TaxID=2371 RepID=UPI000909672C|nr:hypothetical protein [Xylella fastidiosa]